MKQFSLIVIHFQYCVRLILLVFIQPYASEPPPLPLLIFNSTDITENTESNNVNVINCPPWFSVENGKATVKSSSEGQLEIIVVCNTNYTLVGKSAILTQCIDGEWMNLHLERATLPKCEMRCSPPPYLEHGNVTLEKEMADILNLPMGSYSEGTVAMYSCEHGYELNSQSSSVRDCHKGSWTGTDAFCQPTREITCGLPPDVANSLRQPPFPSDYGPIPIGQEVVYQCLSGFKLTGAGKIKCTAEGSWIPEAPSCHKEPDFFSSHKCVGLPLLDSRLQARSKMIRVSSYLVEVHCIDNYQNMLSPCKPSKLYCKKGSWIGDHPRCVEALVCKAPPPVLYSLAINRNFETSYDSDGLSYYPINAQITYECLKGYVLDGRSVITCEQNGCWEPVDMWPTCVRANERSDYFAELNNINAIFISTATGAGVLGILLLACLVVACKRRRALTRAVSLPPVSGGRHAPEVVNDHTILLQNPDRLALIAFADGVQNNQNNALPSYDEATRDRSTLIQVSRLQIQRPHWPNLTVCRTSRNRSSPNIDTGHHVTRHGSFASHTPSMRSGGESMGSTETVTISEGSTNVTLDTASSHSAVSQNPSCRGHCGSLASFDGCSTVNTEGIPLLEENELEEAQASSILIGDNPIVSADSARASDAINMVSSN